MNTKSQEAFEAVEAITMTDKLYLMTEAQRSKQYAALENSIDAVTQEITDHKVMWGEDAIPSRAAQRQNLVLKEREHKDAMEMLQSLLDQPEGEPVAWMTSAGRLCSTETTNLEQGLIYGWQPLYTHPAPFTPITADMVPEEVVYKLWCSGLLSKTGDDGKEFVSRIVNAYLTLEKL